MKQATDLLKDSEWGQAAADLLQHAMERHEVTPDTEVHAVAGRDYGYVQEWELTFDIALIVYGDGGESHCALDKIAPTEEALYEWLIHDGLEGIDALVEFANVRGLGKITEATAEEADRDYCVLIERDYNGPTSETRAAEDDQGHILTLPTLAAAQAWIDEADAGTYCLAHNESGRPTYKIVAV